MEKTKISVLYIGPGAADAAYSLGKLAKIDPDLDYRETVFLNFEDGMKLLEGDPCRFGIIACPHGLKEKFGRCESMGVKVVEVSITSGELHDVIRDHLGLLRVNRETNIRRR